MRLGCQGNWKWESDWFREGNADNAQDLSPNFHIPLPSRTLAKKSSILLPNLGVTERTLTGQELLSYLSCSRLADNSIYANYQFHYIILSFYSMKVALHQTVGQGDS